MKMKFSSALTGAVLVALASTADAGQPLALSDHQMDGVTAGAAALATLAGQAIGESTNGLKRLKTVGSETAVRIEVLTTVDAPLCVFTLMSSGPIGALFFRTNCV